MYWLGIFPTGIWEISCDYYKGRRRQEDPAAEALRQEWQKTVNHMQYWHLLLGDELGYRKSLLMPVELCGLENGSEPTLISWSEG